MPAVQFLRKNEVVAFPTETVYGLGANGLNPEAVLKIFEAKGRPGDNPLILHVSSIEMLEKIAYFDHPEFRVLIQNFWPGPITFILPKKPIVPKEATAGLDTVAVRMPYHPIALTLIDACGFPIAAPSANLSGRPSPTNADMVFKDLNERIPLVIDAGDCVVGLESTVLDLTHDKPRIVRPGSITFEQLSGILPHLETKLEASDKPVAPGMKYAHYKPKMPVIVFSDDHQLDAIIDQHRSVNPAFIGMTPCANAGIKNFCFPSLDEMAQRLYYLFHYLEKEGIDLILIRKIQESGIGSALMNRINKAADLIL